jgi:hypothetical protein
MKNFRFFLIIITIIIIIFSGLVIMLGILPESGKTASSPSYQSPFGKIVIRTDLPETPMTLIFYEVTPLQTDMIDYSIEELLDFRQNVTSESDAPHIAEKQLEKYGGLPSDAVLVSSRMEVATQGSGFSMKKYPIMTEVQYTRHIDKIPVLGEGGVIRVSLGENGELLELYKVWRTVKNSGNAKILPATTAIEKLQRGEKLGNTMKVTGNLNVDNIHMGYFERGYNVSQDYLYPIWIFSGTTSDGDFWRYSVYALQFANFTAVPTSGQAPLTVTFSDTSETSPTKWLWDFGDGTTANVQNPVHTYQTGGVYNITLTAWNEAGSDTVFKSGFISAHSNQTVGVNTTSKNLVGNQGSSGGQS